MRTGQESKAAIICRSSIVKGAISASLEQDGILCVETQEPTDVAIVMAGLVSMPANEQHYSALDGIEASKWVVLSSDQEDPVLDHIMKKGHRPCVVPEDIDARDLAYVVKLAASGHIVSMDRFCSRAQPDDARVLSEANLDKDQWRLLGHLSHGLSNKEIAITENTSESAIKSRLRCLLQRLGLSNRTKAAVLAARCGAFNWN